MALLVARTRLVGHLPRARFRRGLRHTRAFRGLLQRVHDSQARAGEAIALPSDRRNQCPRLDPRTGTLTIPISTAVEALQSNEVYLPRSRLRLDPALLTRQINAIRFGLIVMSHKAPQEFVGPNKDGFERDPFGYSALAWHKWGMAQNLAGYFVDLEAGPVEEDLKSPCFGFLMRTLCLRAARVLLQGTPNLEAMPESVRGACHCQYHAVTLMLVGYSLEICLKAMLIIRNGIAAYQAEEKKHRHHNLAKLASFVPGLTAKDQATLQALSHFVCWAGRYPDPGFGNLSQVDDISTLSEGHQVSAKELFTLAARIMAHSSNVIAEASP